MAAFICSFAGLPLSKSKPKTCQRSQSSGEALMVMMRTAGRRDTKVAGLGIAAALMPLAALAQTEITPEVSSVAPFLGIGAVFSGLMILQTQKGGRFLGAVAQLENNSVDTLDDASFRRLSKRKNAGQFMADVVAAKHKAMSMSNGIYNMQCAEGAAKGEAFMKRHQFMSRVFRSRQRTVPEKARDLFQTRKLATINLGHICNAEEKTFYRFPELAATYCMTKMEMDQTCNRYASPETVEEEYLMKSVEMQMKQRAIPYGVYDNQCCEGRFKGDAEARRVAAGTVAFRARNMTSAQKAAQQFNARRYAYVNGYPCQYEEQIYSKYPAVAASMRADVYRY